jgi:hypothetical protein
MMELHRPTGVARMPRAGAGLCRPVGTSVLFLLLVLPVEWGFRRGAVEKGLTSGIAVNRAMAADRLDYASPASSEERFLAGLRERRLFSVAEAYCRDRLQLAASGSEEQALLATERVRLLASQAANTVRDERVRLYQAAQEAAASFLRDEPDHPRRVWVQFHAALALLAEGEQARREAELDDANAEKLAAARDRIRQAVRACEQLDQDLTALQPQAPPATKRLDPRLTQRELLALRDQLQLVLAHVFQSQALCYPIGSADRLAALERALHPLAELDRHLAPTDPLRAELRLEQADLQRLLGDFPVADQTLQRLDPTTLTPQQKDRLLAARLRLLLGSGKLADAIQFAATQAAQANQAAPTPEWDFAQLELYVTGWEAANQQAANRQGPTGATAARPAGTQPTGSRPNGASSVDPPAVDPPAVDPPANANHAALAASGPTAADWERTALAMARQIEQQHGPYWARRAELLLVGVGRSAGSGSREILERTARDLYRKGQWQDAVSAFEQASRSAEQSGDRQAAFDLAYKAALVEQQRGDPAHAANRFRQIAQTWPQHDLAKNAHQLAILLTAQRARSEPSAQVEYEQLLHEHLLTWDSTETGDQVRFWQGRLFASRQQWREAIETLIRVSPDSHRFPELVPLICTCWLKRLDEQRRAGSDLTSEIDSALAFFDEQERDVLNRFALSGMPTTDPSRAPSNTTSVNSNSPANLASPANANSPPTRPVQSNPANATAGDAAARGPTSTSGPPANPRPLSARPAPAEPIEPKLLAAVECGFTAARIRLLYLADPSPDLVPKLRAWLDHLEALQDSLRVDRAQTITNSATPAADGAVGNAGQSSTVNSVTNPATDYRGQAARSFAGNRFGITAGQPGMTAQAKNNSENATGSAPASATANAPAKPTETAATRSQGHSPDRFPDQALLARLISEARSLLVLVVAGQPTLRGTAEQQIRRLAQMPSDALFSLLNDLELRATKQTAAEQGEVAMLQIHLANYLIRGTSTEITSTMTPAKKAAVERLQARALWRSGDRGLALTAYRDLITRFPDDAELQVAYAQILESDPQDRANLEQALLQWRRILARSQPRSERWFQSKYGIAQCQLFLGDRAAAAQRIRYLQATEKLGGTPWENAFQQLLERCLAP